MSTWIDTAEAALRGEAPEGGEAVPVVTPPVLDGTGTRGVIAPFMAAFFGAAAYLQEQRSGPFDPIALGLRVLALSMTARTIVLGRHLWQRLQIRLAARNYGLALTDGGLLLRTPTADLALAREDILAVKERGDWRKRGGSRWNEVYLITRPRSGRAYVTLPPVFDQTTGVLAERLMRWLGPVEGPEDYEPPPPTELPSKVFEQAAAGDASQDLTVIRHGAAWLRRGPYVTVLVGIAILDGFVRLPAESRDQVGPMAPGLIVFSLLVVPILWALLIRYDIAPRRGLSLVLTPGEMLMRTRQGVHVVRWKNLDSLKLDSKRRWSLLYGQHESRSLVIARSNADTITYLESFLGAPVEVVIALCNAYRKGLLP
ncbi:MAG: hypothetical protein OXR73_35690 [Myxococcales bacterium]|nr:hypothetical protein [Myxococcales bacterium]